MSVPWYYNETRIGKEPNAMILIPAGKFLRGSNNRMTDEGPQYTVETKAYWMDKYEVTNLQYKQFIDATKRKSPALFRNRTYPEGKVDHPVVYVSWYDAHDYCEWPASACRPTSNGKRRHVARMTGIIPGVILLT